MSKETISFDIDRLVKNYRKNSAPTCDQDETFEIVYHMKYQEPTNEQILVACSEFIAEFNRFQTIIKVPDDAIIDSDWSKLSHIAQRIEKRRVYYRIFHKGVKLSELRQAALLAYWISKKKPFQCAFNDNGTITHPELGLINEDFATYIVYLGLKAYADENNCVVSDFEAIPERLRYALNNWDLSKEALMLCIEGMANNIYNLNKSK